PDHRQRTAAMPRELRGTRDPGRTRKALHVVGIARRRSLPAATFHITKPTDPGEGSVHMRTNADAAGTSAAAKLRSVHSWGKHKLSSSLAESRAERRRLLACVG